MIVAPGESGGPYAAARGLRRNDTKDSSAADRANLHTLTEPALENRRRIRIDKASQTSR